MEFTRGSSTLSHNLTALVNGKSRTGRSAQRTEVNHSAFPPKEGVEFARSYQAVSNDLSTVIDVCSETAQTTERPQIS